MPPLINRTGLQLVGVQYAVFDTSERLIMLTQEWRLIAAVRRGELRRAHGPSEPNELGLVELHKHAQAPRHPANLANLPNLPNRDRRQFAARIEVMDAWGLKKKATKREAQKDAGHTEPQWDRFYVWQDTLTLSK